MHSRADQHYKYPWFGLPPHPARHRLAESDPHLKWQISLLRQPDYFLRRLIVCVLATHLSLKGKARAKPLPYRPFLSEVVIQKGALQISTVQSLPLEGKVSAEPTDEVFIKSITALSFRQPPCRQAGNKNVIYSAEGHIRYTEKRQPPHKHPASYENLYVCVQLKNHIFVCAFEQGLRRHLAEVNPHARAAAADDK